VTDILAIANHNGGVGKTITAVNLAAGFAGAGRRTLAVDCGPQAPPDPLAPRPPPTAG
jgi:chromosome partitioning protein